MQRRDSVLTPTSVYVHVPFCVVKCGYCDFNSYPTEGTAELDRFLDGLHTELNLTPLPPTPVSVFLGGGTPTYLDEGRLRRLFAITGRRLNLRGCDEVTMEANPESVTAEKATLAIEAGVSGLWYKYVGLDGKVVGIDRFGISAPGNVVMDELGINTAGIVEALS